MWHHVAGHMSQELWASGVCSVCVHPTGPLFFMPDE